MALNGERALDVYRGAARAYQTEQGGWYPLGSIPLWIWLADPPPFFAKIAQLGLVVINFATFALLAMRLFRTISASILASVIVLAIWQLRIPHDPILGTSFVTPWAAEGILACYAAWMWYVASRRIVFIYIACAAVVACILCTPIGFGVGASFIIPFIVSKSLRVGAAAIFGVAFVTGAISVANGTHFGESTALGTFGASIFAQLIAPFPTTFRAFGHIPVAHVPSLWHGNGYVDDRFIRIPEISPVGWLRAIVLATLGYLAVQRAIATQRTAELRYHPLLIGLTLWLVPAIAIGPKSFWPIALPLGQAFNSVYFQCFGIAILTTRCLLAIARPTVLAIIPPIAGATILLLAYGNIRSDSYAIDQTVRAEYTRDVIQRASVAGFFKLLPTNSTIAVPHWGSLVTGSYSSTDVAKYMLYHYSKLRFNVIETDTAPDPPPNTWVLGTSHVPDSLVSLSHWSANSGSVKLTDESLHFSLLDVGAIGGSRDGIALTSTPLADGFSILARTTCADVSIGSPLEPPTPRIVWGPGFYRPGPVGYPPKASNGQTMLMGSAAYLQVAPAGCKPQSLQFSAIVQAPNAGTLSFGTQGRRQQVALSGAPQAISLDLPRTASRITIDFATDAKAADLNMVYFRYDRDRPLDTRLMISGASLTELETPRK